jgi:hypothetical protein
VFASGALVLRALLIRRRFRRHLQQAIDAGIIPAPPNLQDKPELYDVCIRSVGDAVDWRTILVCCIHLLVDLDAEVLLAYLRYRLGNATKNRR